MTINIITFFWSNNLGALIQAFCLKKFLEKECKKSIKFNSYAPKELIERERMSQINKRHLNVLLDVFSKKIKLFFWKKKFLECSFPSNEILKYDDELYIYGSDEIWNYQNPFFGYDPFFFGKDNIKKKISYATSIGNVNFKNSFVDQIKNYLKDFEKISVRDSSTQKFIKDCTGVNPIIVLDPCYLVNLENILSETKNPDLKDKDYILIYGDYFNKKQIEIIKNFSKKNNWKIISLGFFNPWANKDIISADPLDLIKYVINSKQVFTSMFHVVMLSYKYKKQFWISEDPYRVNKLSYFVQYLDLKNRYLESFGSNEINYTINNNKMSDWINLSKNFIIKNIN